jgi:voltage-gated potassium channel
VEKTITKAPNVMPMRTRLKLYHLLHASEKDNRLSRAIELFLLILIFFNIVSLILESVQEINAVMGNFFVSFESFSIIIFSIEYVLRVWTSVEAPAYRKPVTGRLKYMTSSMAVIDLLAILPFYLAFLPIDLRFLRIIRLFRLFRLLKIVRYLKALKLIQAVLHERKEQIYLSVMFVLFLLVIVSTLMFYVENEAQPTVFSSIPASMLKR